LDPLTYGLKPVPFKLSRYALAGFAEIVREWRLEWGMV